MCYFTKKVLNKRFLPNRKNRWNPPVCTDERFRYVEVECGHCFECRKKKRREWRIRNYEQLKETPHAVFFTGTVSPQRYEYICKKYGYKNDGSQDNEIITKIHRLFLERIRKETGKSVKHWCVTEKGHTYPPSMSLTPLRRLTSDNDSFSCTIILSTFEHISFIS